jgi:hypothetical protein
VLSDVVFEALLVAACLTLLWKPRPGVPLLVASGLAVACSALVRGAGTFVLVVFLVAVLCLRLGWLRSISFLVAALLPLGLYATAYHASHGEYALSTGGPRFLYARLAPDVRCQDPQLKLPPYERKLCPSIPVASRPSSDYYMWGQHRGPAYHLHPPSGMTTEQVLKDFSQRVVRAQPRMFARVTLGAFMHGFAPSRTTEVRGFAARYWLFQDHYWMRTGQAHPRAEPGPAGFLQTYRQWLWTPGPLLGGLLLLALAASLGLGRARRSGDRVAIGLLAGACTIILLTGAALSGFSWRYQLPQLALLPMAGALALAALTRGPAPGRPMPPPELRPLARASSALAGVHPRLRRASERGLLPVFVAATVAALTLVVVTAGAVRSGWFRPGPGLVVGLLAGLIVFVGLVVSHRRTSEDPAVVVPDEVPEPTR